VSCATNLRTRKGKSDFEGAFLTMQNDMLLLIALPHMRNRTDLDHALSAIHELYGQQRRIIRWIQALAVRAWPVNEGGEMPAHFGDIGDVPVGEINHMRTKIAQNTVRALQIKAPCVLTRAAVAADLQADKRRMPRHEPFQRRNSR